MKFSKIYSNKNAQFHNIEFYEGLNVVLAEITDKSKTEKDTHNLGKTLLISIIDFLLLKNIRQRSKFFLTKGGFEEQVFFAEIKLNSGKYIIIRRDVDNPTKISFKINEYKLDGFQTQLNWDEENLPLDKAKKKLNEYLGFDVLPAWDYRKSVTYFLRTQNDFRDVFKLDKFKGRDKDWKPFMFDVLGFNGAVIRQKYDLEDEKKESGKKIETLQQEADINIEERDKITGLLDIKTDDKKKIEEKIDKFNFYENDKAINKELVEDIDSRIQLLNTKRYSHSFEIKKIESSLSANQDTINLNKLKSLYKDVEIYFPDKLVHSYEMLLDFRKTITEERNKVLHENLKKIKKEFAVLDKELKELEVQKEGRLAYLTEKDSYLKFKETQKQLAKIEADIIRLKDKLEVIDRTSLFVRDIETKQSDIDDKIKEMHVLIGEQKHSEIRKIFNYIIKEILSTNALLSLKQNQHGNVEFEANIQNPMDLTITEEDYGNTYRKLLCIAFDLSILIHYANKSFYRFVYHDGALEALDDRKKIKFLSLIRRMCSEYDLQYILTLIDSDLPKDENGNIIEFPDNEVCLRLHDRDDGGKLFKKSF
jgi:uncharacterized protein YydD (DUF2326 family)